MIQPQLEIKENPLLVKYQLEKENNYLHPNSNNEESFEISNANMGQVEDNQLDNNNIIMTNDHNIIASYNNNNINSRKSYSENAGNIGIGSLETDEVVEINPNNNIISNNDNNVNTITNGEANNYNNNIQVTEENKENENANNEDQYTQYDTQLVQQNKLDISNRSKSIDSANKQDQNKANIGFAIDSISDEENNIENAFIQDTEVNKDKEEQYNEEMPNKKSNKELTNKNNKSNNIELKPSYSHVEIERLRSTSIDFTSEILSSINNKKENHLNSFYKNHFANDEVKVYSKVNIPKNSISLTKEKEKNKEKERLEGKKSLNTINSLNSIKSIKVNSKESIKEVESHRSKLSKLSKNSKLSEKSSVVRGRVSVFTDNLLNSVFESTKKNGDFI